MVIRKGGDSLLGIEDVPCRKRKKRQTSNMYDRRGLDVKASMFALCALFMLGFLLQDIHGIK